MHSTGAALVAACANCGAALHGSYCSDCGQKHQPQDPSLHDLWHEVVHEFLHLDGKIFLTLRLLFLRPGQLTADRLAGRRARLIGALRLYLTFSVLYFVIAGFVPSITSSGNGVSVKGDPAKMAEQKHGPALTFLLGRVQRLEHKLKEDPAEVRHAFQSALSKALFVLVPLFAACLRLAFRGAGRRYPAFLYFALDYHSFAFAALALARLTHLTRSVPIASGVGTLFSLAVVVYLVLALRRLFRRGLVSTTARAALAGAIYLPLFVVGVFASALATLMAV